MLYEEIQKDTINHHKIINRVYFYVVKEIIRNNRMKSLADYVRKELENPTDHSNESVYVTITPPQLYESYGIVYGCPEMADIIVDKITKIWPKYKDNTSFVNVTFKSELFSGIKNVFFKTLIIHVTEKLKSGYDVLHSYLNNDNIFEIVEINVNPTEKHLNLVVTHELVHAYEDYQRALHYAKSLRQIFYETDYKAAINKIINTSSKQIEKLAADTIYRLNQEEINANISALTSMIKNKTFDSYSKGIELAKNIPAYNTYIGMSKFIENAIEKKLPNNVIDDYCDALREYKKYNSMSNAEIIHTVEKKLLKFFKKLNKHVYSLIYDKVNNCVKA